jgi:two-component system LytT family response regulator
MISSLIIDDEPKAIALLCNQLRRHCPDVNVIGQAGRIDEAIKLIEAHRPQLLFLDIQLAEGTGFDLLEKIEVRNFHVIFITAHSEFAIKAFRFSVTDYLLKPVSRELLIQAVQKVKNLIDIKHSTSAVQTLRIPVTKGVAFTNIMNIVRLEAEGPYTHIFLDNGQHIMSSHHLKQFEEHLDPNVFLRIHRSHLINKMKISKVNETEKIYIEMADGFQIEVPRRSRQDFLKQWSAAGDNNLLKYFRVNQ